MTDVAPVLVVEDDGPTQRLLQVVLQRAGLPSEVARDGRDAIALLSSRPFSLVILDVMMPALDGRSVLAWLSEQERRTPVIVCSAAGPAALSEFHANPLVAAVVRKPFEVDHFTGLIHSAIDPLRGSWAR